MSRKKYEKLKQERDELFK